MSLPDQPVYQACYRSTPIADPKTVILDIVRLSEVNNHKLGVSGMLYFSPVAYFQMIEGSEKNVLKLMDSIRLDARHAVIWESYRQVVQRSFRTELPMGYIDDADLRSGAIDNGFHPKRDDYSKAQADIACQFLVTSGQQKYPSMSYTY